MKKGILLFLILFGFMFLIPEPSVAQDVGNNVIELKTAEIKVKIETPQVKLYSSRIKPEFDDVHLEKSFKKEIIGLGETFEVKKAIQNKINKRIDIDKVLKKLR